MVDCRVGLSRLALFLIVKNNMSAEFYKEICSIILSSDSLVLNLGSIKLSPLKINLLFWSKKTV